MATIHPRGTRTGLTRWDVRWRGPDLDDRGRLREHSKAFANRELAEAYLMKLPEVRQVPARCGCRVPRWVLVDATVLALGDITCSICSKPFTAVEPEKN